MPEAVSVFILPPSFAVLEKRLRRRATDSEEAVQKRLAAARGEILQAADYDYMVVNDAWRIASAIWKRFCRERNADPPGRGI